MGTDSDPPGPSGLPLVGNTYQFASDPLQFYEETAREYGPVARYELAGDEFYQVSDPDLVEQVLVHDNEKFRKGEQYHEALGPVLGNGLLLSEGEFWREQRHRMQPAFNPDALDEYAPVMVEYTERLLDSWADGEVRDVHGDMMQLTVEIAAQALFDVDIRAYESDIADALATVMDRSEQRLTRPVDIPDSVPTPTNRRYRRALSALDDIAAEIVADHDAGGDDVVSMLLTAKEQSDALDEEQIKDEVVTLLLAGHETTALALTYTLFALATNPEQTAKLQEEVDDVLGDRSPTDEDIPDLPYTQRTVREGMRVYPPVQGVIRETAEPVELGGYAFPAGTTVSMQQWVLHRDPRFYDDPEAFRPSRWTDDFERDLPAFAYFPFGGGPRRCIGDNFAKQEARLALATMAKDWAVEPVTAELSFAPSITLRPDEPVKLRVRRRE
ncbi:MULTISPECIES: cytochrome P450 [Salinibaculum]|uniref:cytochrome P450 n=1 Tax=Salinibaculum TaxID=2732368 RepID=UPI0030CBA5CF